MLAFLVNLEIIQTSLNMSTQAPSLKQYSPGVLSLLPLYYVGWSDSVLSPSEVKLIAKKIEELPFLDQVDKKLLLQWSDPKSPPSPQLFKQWVGLIKQAASKLPPDKKWSLAALGIEMAKKSAGPEDQIMWASEATNTALREVEEALGIHETSGHRSILPTAPAIGIRHFDVAQMTQFLDDEFADIINRTKTLLKDPVFTHPKLRNKEDYRLKTLAWCQAFADQGLGAIAFPAAYGGQEDMAGYLAVLECMGYHDLSLAIKYGVQFGLFGGSVYWLGTQYHHDKYLAAIGSLELPGCFAMTETGHGSNVRGLQTTATYDPVSDEIIVHTPTLNDGKEYIGNALHGHMASVFAQLIVDGENHGVHAVLVPMREPNGQLLPGITVEDCGYKLGLNGVDNGRIWFDQVRVPRQNLLNRFGHIDEAGVYSSPIENPGRRFFTMLGTLVGGRVGVPRAGLSATKTALSIAIRYGLKRRQFAPKEGEPETVILDYPTHQRRLMPLLAKTYALHFALTYLTKRYINRSEADIREIETLAAGLKSYSTWFTTEAIQECREACGGKGYLSENRFADLKADSDIFTTFEGDNTVLMQLVAKGLLSDFKKAFHDEGFLAVIRFITSQVGDTFSKNNPFQTRRTDAEHLLDPVFQLEAFTYRERVLLYSVSARMRNYLSRRMDPYDAFLRCQVHMVELAEAYVEKVVLQQFQLKVLEAGPDLSSNLKRLCDLYALHTLEKNKGWYLEQDYMQGAKTKAIRRLVDKLCLEVRQEAEDLVQAFAIPEEAIAAPIVVETP